jgi:hypothetical protein
VEEGCTLGALLLAPALLGAAVPLLHQLPVSQLCRAPQPAQRGSDRFVRDPALPCLARPQLGERRRVHRAHVLGGDYFTEANALLVHCATSSSLLTASSAVAGSETSA